MKMKSRTTSFLLSILLLVFALAGCANNGDSGETESPDEIQSDSGTTAQGTDDDEAFTVYAPLSGDLGDKSFMDSAARGLEQAETELGAVIKIIPASTNDPQAWERNLREAAQNEAVDLVVTGGTVVASTLEEVAPDFPDKHFLIFDAESTGDNVTGISYKQNEGAFLAGVMAAYITQNPDPFPNAQGTNRVGFVGGADIPVGQDFLAGFTDGVKYVDPDIEVDARFTGDFVDAQKGYDVTMAIYDDGADVVYHAAGPCGLGVLKAAEAAGRYGLGSDSNQNDLHPGFIPASVIKAVDKTVFEAITACKNGTLEKGMTIYGDVSNQGMDLEMDGDLVPDEIAQKIEEVKAKIASGEIVPASYYD